MEIKPKKEYYLENAARLQASMLKLPVDVMVSSMESVTRTLHEIQIQSQADHLEEEGLKANSAAAVFKHSVLPFVGMLKIPGNVLASSVNTVAKNLQEIKDRPEVPEEEEDQYVPTFDPCIVPLSDDEACIERAASESAIRITGERTIVWRIGRPGRNEFQRKWKAQFDYRIGEDIDAINSPRLPNFITVKDGPRPLGSTQKLNIHFELDRSYTTGELVFVYDRWGGEKDEVFIDDKLISPVGGAGKGMFKHVELMLGAVEVGQHIISIIASGDSDADGHRIDFLELMSIKEVEPDESQ